MKRLLALAASLLLLAGCGANPIESDGGVRISTVGNTLSRNAPVPFVVQNGTDATMQIPACGGRAQVTAEKMENGNWVAVAGTPCGDGVSTAAVQLSPGGTLQGDKTITAPGQYRLRLVFTATGGGATNFAVLSNEFTVT
jgi:hypothetical protein